MIQNERVDLKRFEADGLKQIDTDGYGWVGQIDTDGSPLSPHLSQFLSIPLNAFLSWQYSYLCLRESHTHEAIETTKINTNRIKKLKFSSLSPVSATDLMKMDIKYISKRMIKILIILFIINTIS